MFMFFQTWPRTSLGYKEWLRADYENVSPLANIAFSWIFATWNSWNPSQVYAKFQFQIVFDGKTNDSEIKLYCINLHNILSLPWGRTFGLRSTLDATWFVANWDHPNRSRGQRSQAQQKASEKVMRYAGLKRGARLVNWYQCHVIT
jgi:hypothetical protein